MITNSQGQMHQTLAYCPFGEPLIDVSNGSYDVENKFSGQIFDKESGLYSFPARPQDPYLGIFITPDRMWWKSPHLTSYHYCSNNPIMRIDPTGMTDYTTEKGKVIGNDGKNDGNIRVVTDKKEIKTIQDNHKNKTTTPLDNVKSGAMTTRTELGESLNVLDRVVRNGGINEESSVIPENGGIFDIVRGERANGDQGNFPYVDGNNNTSIHGHPTAITEGLSPDGRPQTTSYDVNPTRPPDVPNDIETFRDYKRNIIVGNLQLGSP